MTASARSTLADDRTTAVLDRLFTAESGDEAALTAFQAAHPGKSIADFDERELAELFADVYIPVPRQVGELLHLLVRTIGATRVVEFGTSYGISTIYLAAAVRDNGGGHVVTTELHPDKARAAGRNLADAGLADLVDIRVGDAVETLRHLDGPVDLLLLDGWLHLSLPVLRVVERHLRPGALVIADDLDVEPEIHEEYLAYVRDPANGYHSIGLSLGDGIEVSLRTQA